MLAAGQVVELSFPAQAPLDLEVILNLTSKQTGKYRNGEFILMWSKPCSFHGMLLFSLISCKSDLILKSTKLKTRIKITLSKANNTINYFKCDTIR